MEDWKKWTEKSPKSMLRYSTRKLKKIKIGKKIKPGKRIMSDIKNDKHEIAEIISVSLIIAIFQGLAIVIGVYLTYEVWQWSPLLIVAQIIGIPTVISWLTKKFDKKELAYERKISKLKETHYREMVAKNNELNSEKINSQLGKKEAEMLRVELELLRSKTK